MEAGVCQRSNRGLRHTVYERDTANMLTRLFNVEVDKAGIVICQFKSCRHAQ